MICKHCFDAVGKHLPKIPEDKRLDLLFSATAYPMGGCEHVEEQLIELSQKTDGTLGQCSGFANEELDAAMAKYREETDDGV